MVFLGFRSFIWASGSPGSSWVPLVPPSRPWVLGTLCPCPPQRFPSQTKVLTVVHLRAFLHGIPASTSPVYLWAFPSPIASVSPISPEVWLPGSPTVFPLGTHVFAPVSTVPTSSTTPGSHQITASPTGWRASSPKPVSPVRWCFYCG